MISIRSVREILNLRNVSAFSSTLFIGTNFDERYIRNETVFSRVLSQNFRGLPTSIVQ